MRRSVSGFCHVELHSVMWLEIFQGNIKLDHNELYNHVSLIGLVHLGRKTELSYIKVCSLSPVGILG